MNFNSKDLINKDEIGVYCITNTVNKKMYIGSTKKSFLSRYKTHFEKLRSNNHKSYTYLQNSVNKYGIDKFTFSILEIVYDKDEILEKEKYYINIFKSYDRNHGYNINRNPKESPMLNSDTRRKVSNTLSEMYKNGTLKANSTSFKKGAIPWNKGKKYISTNHLKVKKNNKADRTNINAGIRKNLLILGCFTLNGTLLFEGKSYEIYEQSLKENSIFKDHISGKNKILYRHGITKSVLTEKPYKSLIFKKLYP